MKKVNESNLKSGFTLVELAIVLVIIGLIIGGVLVGQDMIKSAEVRSTISQWEKYNTALNTFRDKFGGYPGDLRNADNFGFDPRTSASIGNGLIEGCTTTPLLLGCETAVFFDDLATAEIIADNIPGLLAAYTANVAAVAGNGDLITPEADIGGGARWSVYAAGGRNQFHLGGIDTGTTAGGTTTDTVEPIEAFNIDNKIDDSVGNTGIVRAVEGRNDAIGTPTPETGVAGECTTDNSTYNTDENNPGESTTPACQLMIRMN